MIDTHSHIYSEEFDEDREAVIARAIEAGVEMIMLPAIDSESHERQERLALSRSDLFRQIMGLHPTSVKEDFEAELEIVRQKLFTGTPNTLSRTCIKQVPTSSNTLHPTPYTPTPYTKYVAVGEIGLDFYWDTTFREQQIQVLRTQMAWAEELGLPVVLHLRSGKDGNNNSSITSITSSNNNSITSITSSNNNSIPSITSSNAYKTFFSLCGGTQTPVKLGRERYRGIMHCFSGSVEDARKGVEMGFLLGIGGVVTYKKSSLPEIVREVGLENIVLETDAPYLAPVPFRGRRNESGYVKFVAEKVAEILGVSFEEVEAVTTGNAKRVFGLEDI